MECVPLNRDLFTVGELLQTNLTLCLRDIQHLYAQTRNIREVKLVLAPEIQLTVEPNLNIPVPFLVDTGDGYAGETVEPFSVNTVYIKPQIDDQDNVFLMARGSSITLPGPEARIYDFNPLDGHRINATYLVDTAAEKRGVISLKTDHSGWLQYTLY